MDTGMGEHPGAVLRRLRYTGGRRLSQRALATLLGTSRAHIARLELHGSPPLTDEQLDRLEKAGDAVRPPFSRAEIDELRTAMHTVRSATIEQADKAVEDIATRAGWARSSRPQTGRTNNEMRTHHRTTRSRIRTPADVPDRHIRRPWKRPRKTSSTWPGNAGPGSPAGPAQSRTWS